MDNNIINIAIADDHELYLKGLKMLLETKENFKVGIEAKNGQELINKLSKSTKLPNIVLLDMKMPVLNGFNTLLEIRKRWKDLKVLIISSYGHEYVVVNSLKNGANGYILKDSSVSDLYNAVTSVIHKSYYHTDNVHDFFIKVNEINQLNNIELQFLFLCCEELTYSEIAEKMHVSPRTVENYRVILFNKLKVQSRTGLVTFALKNGLI